MPEQFLTAGDDPSISANMLDPSVTPLTDTSLPGYLDPIANYSALDTMAPNPYLYGVTGGIPGPAAPAGYDPSAFNASLTTASRPGSSIMDSILKLGTLGLGISSAVANRGGTVSGNMRQANPVTTSRLTGGTSSTLLYVAIAGFVGLVLLLEMKR